MGFILVVNRRRRDEKRQTKARLKSVVGVVLAIRGLAVIMGRGVYPKKSLGLV
jgi:hypothetical protein